MLVSEEDDKVKLKYPIRKYLVPWFVGIVSITSLVRLGNHTFTFLAVVSTLILYGVLRLAAKQIEKKDKEIETLKKSVLRSN